jgi:hypothetical protein
MKKYLVFWTIAVAASSAAAQTAVPEKTGEAVNSVRIELEELRKMETQIQQRMRALEQRLDRLDGGTPTPAANREPSTELEPVPAAAVIAGQPTPGVEAPWSAIEALPEGDTASGDIWSMPLGSGSNLRLMDIALTFTGAGGWSTQGGESLQQLEGGHHDPNVRGFTLQDLELYIGGAVDPYFNAQATLSFSVNSEGETNFEIEEGFATSQQLLFGVERYGLGLQAGWFFAHFGRWNQQHVHNWLWVDQPIVTTRFFGADNLRQAGVNLSWLIPIVPWYSHLDLGVQNSVGETMYSFGANDEVGAIPEGEHGGHGGGHGHLDMGLPGGRPFVTNDVRNLADMTYELRFANAFDLGESWSTELGASAALGPNPTGKHARTWIAGVDWTAKWRPTPSDRGWPYVILQAEALWRNYEAAEYMCDEEYPCDELGGFLPERTLKGFGVYAQAIWGFHRGWSVGLRGEYAKGTGGPSYELHEGHTPQELVIEPVAIRDDPYRSERWRISPLLMYQPTHFSKIALQYNYDHTTFLDRNNNHTVWLQFQFTLGSEPAHRY